MRCREPVRTGRLHEAWSASVDTKAKHFAPQVKFVRVCGAGKIISPRWAYGIS